MFGAGNHQQTGTMYSELYSSLNYGLRTENGYTLSREEMLRC